MRTAHWRAVTAGLSHRGSSCCALPVRKWATPMNITSLIRL